MVDVVAEGLRLAEAEVVLQALPADGGTVDGGFLARFRGGKVLFEDPAAGRGGVAGVSWGVGGEGGDEGLKAGHEGRLVGGGVIGWEVDGQQLGDRGGGGGEGGGGRVRG